MISTNTNKLGFDKSRWAYFEEKFIVYLFSFLPISLILGNSAINLNIIIINLFFLYTCYHQKKWLWLTDKYLYFFIFIWTYLIFNSLISSNITMIKADVDPSPNVNIGGLSIAETFDYITKQVVYPQKESLTRSLGFIRFVIFLFAMQHFFINSKKTFDKIFKYWSIILIVIFLDVIFERIFGFNLLGFTSPSSHRVVSFFKDELVVGGFLLGFSFLAAGFLLKSSKKNFKKKILSNIFFCLPIICIYLSGERSNFIKTIFIASVILFFVSSSYFLIRKRYAIISIIILIFLSTLFSKDVYFRQIEIFKSLKLKYVTSIGIGKEEGSIYDRFGHIRHFAHYDTAWKIFRDYPVFGVGNSKFRYICHSNKYHNEKITYTNQRCNNHPHQTHLELLSEQGILGYLIIIIIVFKILFESFKTYLKSGNTIHLASILYVLSCFIPLLPSGSFFSTFNGSIFWINFSIMYALLNKKNKL